MRKLLNSRSLDLEESTEAENVTENEIKPTTPDIESTHENIDIGGKLKILFLAADPSNTSRLKLGEEIREIEQALRRGKYRNHFQLEQHWAVRISDLQALLLESRPHIVHFSGHGSAESEIILQDEQGLSRPIPQKALKTLFELLKGNIHCVVLNSCYSRQQANSIAESIDCVVGMSDAIRDQAAIRFSSSFYQALAFGESVEQAFKLGCNQINLEGMEEEDKPKLIAYKSDPSKVFLVSINNENTDSTDLSERTTTKQEYGIDIANTRYKNKYRYTFILSILSFVIIGSISYKLWLGQNGENATSSRTVHEVRPDPPAPPSDYRTALPKIPPALETISLYTNQSIPNSLAI